MLAALCLESALVLVPLRVLVLLDLLLLFCGGLPCGLLGLPVHLLQDLDEAEAAAAAAEAHGGGGGRRRSWLGAHLEGGWVWLEWRISTTI